MAKTNRPKKQTPKQQPQPVITPPYPDMSEDWLRFYTQLSETYRRWASDDHAED